jgi:site-specific recombinase XerD
MRSDDSNSRNYRQAAPPSEPLAASCASFFEPIDLGYRSSFHCRAQSPLFRLVAHVMIRLLIVTPLPAPMQAIAALFPVSILWPIVRAGESERTTAKGRARLPSVRCEGAPPGKNVNAELAFFKALKGSEFLRLETWRIEDLDQAGREAKDEKRLAFCADDERGMGCQGRESGKHLSGLGLGKILANDGGFLDEIVHISRPEPGLDLDEQKEISSPCDSVELVQRAHFETSESALTDVCEVKEEDVVSFVSWLKAQRSRRGALLSPATVESWLDHVRGFFAFFLKRGIVLVDPTACVRLPREERLPRGILSEPQARRLMESPSPASSVGLRDRAILEVLYGSGLRVGECARLEITDVDLVNAAVFVRDGKGRKDRVVPLSACAVSALDAYLRAGRSALCGRLRESGLFVSTITGRRLTVCGIQQLVSAHARRAGIPTPLHPHSLRHTCATHLLRGGADVRHVQKILGHKNLRSTMLYTRVDTSDLRRMIEKSHPRERRAVKRRKC